MAWIYAGSLLTFMMYMVTPGYDPMNRFVVSRMRHSRTVTLHMNQAVAVVHNGKLPYPTWSVIATVFNDILWCQLLGTVPTNVPAMMPSHLAAGCVASLDERSFPPTLTQAKSGWVRIWDTQGSIPWVEPPAVSAVRGRFTLA